MNQLTRHRWSLAPIVLGIMLAGGCGYFDPPDVEPQDPIAMADTDIDALEPMGSDDAPVVPANFQQPEESTALEPSETITEDDTVPAADSAGGFSREQTLIASLTIFVLAMFVGFEVITKVPPTLHTPLMSGSNAISGITIVGAALMAGNGVNRWAMFFGFVAVILASVNVVGGFMVTDRMLAMFKRK